MREFNQQFYTIRIFIVCTLQFPSNLLLRHHSFARARTGVAKVCACARWPRMYIGERQKSKRIIMSGKSTAPTQPMLPRRASAETLAGLRCTLVGETDSAFACPICSRVLRLPQLTDCCGNHFCTSCLSRWLQMSSSCPLCRQIGFKSIRDKKIERAVQDMEVYTHKFTLNSPLMQSYFIDESGHSQSLYIKITFLALNTKRHLCIYKQGPSVSFRFGYCKGCAPCDSMLCCGGC